MTVKDRKAIVMLLITMLLAIAPAAIHADAATDAYKEGLELQKSSNFEAAAVKFIEAAGLTESAPHKFSYTYAAGASYMRIPKYEQAREMFIKAMALSDVTPYQFFSAKRMIASTYVSEKDWDNARPLLNEVAEATTAHPDHRVAAYITLSHVEVMQKNYDATFPYLLAAQAVPDTTDASKSNILINIGNAHMRKGEADQALEHYNKALMFEGLSPSYISNSYIQQASVYMNLLKDYDKAIEYYRKTIAVEGAPPSHHVTSQYQIVICYERAGRNDEALAYAKQIIDQPNMHPVYKKNLQNLIANLSKPAE